MNFWAPFIPKIHRVVSTIWNIFQVCLGLGNPERKIYIYIIKDIKVYYISISIYIYVFPAVSVSYFYEILFETF